MQTKGKKPMLSSSAKDTLMTMIQYGVQVVKILLGLIIDTLILSALIVWFTPLFPHAALAGTILVLAWFGFNLSLPLKTPLYQSCLHAVSNANTAEPRPIDEEKKESELTFDKIHPYNSPFRASNPQHSSSLLTSDPPKDDIPQTVKPISIKKHDEPVNHINKYWAENSKNSNALSLKANLPRGSRRPPTYNPKIAGNTTL